MASFLSELKRRNVFKVGVAYAIVAWLLIQISATVLPTFDAPHWVLQTITFVIILGFPLALFFAWAFELTPEGIKPTQAVVPEESITRTTGQKLNHIIIGLMALAIAFLVIDNYVMKEDSSQKTEVRSEESDVKTKQKNISDTDKQIEEEILPNSVAVLPFENMSPDKNNAYFADGLHEEILNQLAKLRGLNVIARTTMRQYAETDKTPEQIASELKVQTVMEGSVRYADGVVRVTAQLIDGKKDVHLWSETYDRPFKDIFGIESDIAMNVANAMAVAFSTEEQAQIEKKPTNSTEAYNHLILAQSLYNDEGGGGAVDLEAADRLRRRILEEYQKAVALDPDFGLAWVRMAQFMNNVTYNAVAQSLPWDQQQLQEVTQRAYQFAPELPAASILLSGTYVNQRQWQLAENMLQDALARVSPNDYQAIRSYGYFLVSVGRANDAISYLEHAARLDPSVRELNSILAFAYEAAGEDTRAMAEYRAIAEKYHTPQSAMGLFWKRLANGDITGALQEYIHYTGVDPRVNVQSQTNPFFKMFYGAMAHLDDKEAGVEILHNAFADPALDNGGGMANIAFFAAYFGDPELSIEALQKSLTDNTGLMPIIWTQIYQPVRKHPGFKQLMADLKLVDYWRHSTWPVHCRPIDAEDIECD